MDIVLLVIAGIVGGFLAGLLGIGGSPIYSVIFSDFIPNLYSNQITENEVVQLIISNTIFAQLFASASGCWQHYKRRNFYPKTILTIAIPAIFVSLLLTYLLSTVSYSKNTFSIIFILLFIPLLYKMLVDNPNKKRFNQPYRIKVIMLNLIGCFSGTITALSGLGGGFILVPLLNSLFNIKIRKVLSISLGIILVVSSVLTFYNLFLSQLSTTLPYSYGTICFSLVLPVVFGVVIAAPLGVYVGKKLSPYQLRIIFILFCVAMIIKTFFSLLLDNISF